MPTFTYRARQENGALTRGTLRAANEDRATSLLRSNGLTPISIERTGNEAISALAASIGAVGQKELIAFLREIAFMIQAGVPIIETLKAIQKQSKKEKLSKIIRELIYDIEAGESLSLALSKHSGVFNQFTLGIIRTGEASGKLGQSLESIANQLEEAYAFQRKIRAALIYPVLVLVLVVVLVIVMFTFVLPQLVGLFESAQVELPLPTRILIAITNFLTNYWIILLAFLGALGLLFRSWINTAEGRYTFSTIMLGIPILREIIQKLYLARMTSILSTMFESDVPVLEALTLARDSIGNRVYQRILDDTVQSIKDGASISYVWGHEPYIPPMLTTIISVGEHSGDISASFKQANRFFARDLEDVLGTITVLLEPVIIIVLGIGVGIIVGSVLLPIYNLVLVIS